MQGFNLGNSFQASSQSERSLSKEKEELFSSYSCWGSLPGSFSFASSVLPFYISLCCISVNCCMSELLPSFSSSALFFIQSHLSLVRNWKEPGNNRQGRRLIGPQRIRSCSRGRSLEEGWSEKQQVLVTKGSETQVPWEASTGAQENVPKSDKYMERSKLSLLFSNYPLDDIETFIVKIHPEILKFIRFSGTGDEHLVCR